MLKRIGALVLVLLMMGGAGAESGIGQEAAESGSGAEKAQTETGLPEEETPETAREGRKARDISEFCLFNGRPGGPTHILNDGAYKRVFETGLKNGVHSVEVAVTEGDPLGALYIQWAGDPVPVSVQVPAGEDWVTVASTEDAFCAAYIAFPETTRCRIVNRDNPAKQLRISEMRALTAGEPGEDIQVWRKAGDKVDLMLIAGHPDDELIWFGGALPYYAGERGKDTLVITCAMSVEMRMLELCDALWACGVRIHPIFLHRLDFSDTDVRKVLKKWHAEDETLPIIIGLIREHKPDVLLLQDVNGEYGHGIHRASCWLGQRGAEGAADPEADPASAAAYGTWDVPKVYIHLWPENQIQMDWKQPLEAFGGRTGLEAAQDALQYHKSQVVHGWKVEDGGEHDNSLFGLYRTTVGPDEAKNDFFEHIDPAETVSAEDAE